MSTLGSILPMKTKHAFGQGSRAGIELLPKRVRVGICRSLNSYIPLLGGSGYFIKKKKKHTTGARTLLKVEASYKSRGGDYK